MSSKRLAMRWLLAWGDPAWPGLHEFHDWLGKKFPKQKFSWSVDKNGSAIWDFRIRDGDKFSVWGKISGWEGNRRYQVLVYNGTGMGPRDRLEVGYSGNPPPSFRDIKRLVEPHIADHQKVRWRKKGITEEQAKALDQVIRNAVRTIQTALPKFPVAKIVYGDVSTGTFETFVWEDDEHGSLPRPFRVSVDTRSKKFELEMFGVKFPVKTLRALVTLLDKKLATALRKSLKTQDPAQVGWWMGKVTPDTVIRRVVGVTADFSTVDEWHTTELKVELMLRTSKPVPQKLAVQWCKDHWREIQGMAPKNSPPPAEDYRAQGYRDWDEREDDDDYDSDMFIDTHETPEPGLGWVMPRSVTPDHAQMWWSQDGRRGTLTVTNTIR